jgi:hypothetical protein
MNLQLTRSQEKKLNSYVKDIKDDDEYDLTISDQILELFLPAKIGIREYGLNVENLMKIMGISQKDYRTICRFRSSISAFCSSMIKEGFPFGGIKDKGELKKYGWSTLHEFEEIQNNKKERCAKEISNALHYFDDSNKLTNIGKTFLKEVDKQLELFKD